MPASTDTFTDHDLDTIVSGIFAPALASRLTQVSKPQSDMPVGDHLYHYVGRTAAGKFVIWVNADHTVTDQRAYWVAMTAAYAMAAMDSGYAGPGWQKRYHEAADPLALGRAFARAFQHKSDVVREKSLGDIAWIKKTILRGTPRSTAYRLLKQRGFVAIKYDYIPGKHTGPGSCSYEDTTDGRWPRMNQTLPSPGPCNPAGEHHFVPNPSATVDFDLGFTIACSTEESLTFNFDLDDKLTTVQDSGESQACL